MWPATPEAGAAAPDGAPGDVHRAGRVGEIPIACSPLTARSVCGRRARVFFVRGSKWARKSRRINEMQSDLVFRGAHQECAHNSKEISRFTADLVFRDVPGKSVQRRGYTQRLRHPLLAVAPLKTIAGRVVRVLRPPPRLTPFPSRRLAIRLTACALTWSDSRIGTEPPAADGTGSLPGSGHRDSSSPRPAHRSGGQIKRGGSFFESRDRKLFASAEGARYTSCRDTFRRIPMKPHATIT